MYAGLSVDEQLSMPDGEDLTDLPYLLDDDGDGEGENDEDDESRRLNWHDLLEMTSTSQRVRRGLLAYASGVSMLLTTFLPLATR